MEKILLLGAAEGCEDIIREAIKFFCEKSDVDIVGVVIDDDELHGKMFEGKYVINSLDDVMSMQYDKIYVCAINKLTHKIERIIKDGLQIADNKCVSFIQPRIGKRYVESLESDEDIDLYRIAKNFYNLNKFEHFFYNKEHRHMRKWLHYLEVYDRHLNKYCGKSPIILEVGVYKGGSMQMWKDYFGEGTIVIGVDIDKETKAYEENDIHIEIGSQDDREFWKYIKEKYPRIDILVDDGGHRMEQQIITFEEVFPHLSYGGCYICEDLHTSYWKRFGGEYKNESTFIEYSKNFIDYINAWHSETDDLRENIYTRTMYSVSYYTSMLVVEKARVGYPVELVIE